MINTLKNILKLTKLIITKVVSVTLVLSCLERSVFQLPSVDVHPMENIIWLAKFKIVRLIFFLTISALKYFTLYLNKSTAFFDDFLLRW